MSIGLPVDLANYQAGRRYWIWDVGAFNNGWCSRGAERKRIDRAVTLGGPVRSSLYRKPKTITGSGKCRGASRRERLRSEKERCMFIRGIRLLKEGPEPYRRAVAREFGLRRVGDQSVCFSPA